MRVAVRVKALGAAAVLVACAWACGRAETARVCVPGETRVCDGESACRGAQVCAAEGGGFGACDCGARAADAGALEQDAGPHAQYNQLAARCQRDRDCGPDLFCWTSTARSFFGREGGAAGGYCTAACATLADCTAFDAQAGCGNGLCLLGCFAGQA